MFQGGHFGVELFFIVSGFVISLTLRRCASPVDFTAKRIARLVPAMLVCSVTTFVIINYMVPTAAFDAKLVDFLPSWTFTAPALWTWVDGDVQYIDNAYWTLFVEVRFYAWACVFYFLFKERFEVYVVVFAAIAIALYLTSHLIGAPSLAKVIDFLFISRHLAWFVAGILFYRIYDQRGDRFTYVSLVLVALFLAAYMPLSAKSFDKAWIALAFACLNLGLFATFVLRPQTFDIPGARTLQLIGLSSYPLYLLHQKIGVTLISQIDPALPVFVQLILVGAIVAGLIGAAVLIYRTVEVPGKTLLQRALLSGRPRGLATS